MYYKGDIDKLVFENEVRHVVHCIQTEMSAVPWGLYDTYTYIRYTQFINFRQRFQGSNNFENFSYNTTVNYFRKEAIFRLRMSK